MNLIEAENILNILVFLYSYLLCCHICRLGSFMEDFLYSVKIRESILVSCFTRHFGSAEKSVKLILLLNCESRVDLQCPGNTVQIYVLEESLRSLAAKKITQIYLTLPVFGKCLKWVFQVRLGRFPVGRDSLEVKKIIKVKFL